VAVSHYWARRNEAEDPSSFIGAHRDTKSFKPLWNEFQGLRRNEKLRRLRKLLSQMKDRIKAL
jgi:hypothetical protein